jgi:hypothetical protein
MILFLMALLAAAILGIPGQPLWVFGALVDPGIVSLPT